MPSVTGYFTVTPDPAPPDEAVDGVSLGRLKLSKAFEGDLVGTSTVEMLTAIGKVRGSAGYVAIERVSATLEGRAGTFVLQHSGTMTRGQGTLRVSVVPDSGTGALTGLTGAMTIDVEGGKHAYTFDYEL